MGLKPQFRILANQADVTAAIADRLISLRITDEAGFQSDTLEIVLADDDPAAPIAMPSTGVELEVFLGYDTAATRMGLFVADEVEVSGWPGEMTIRGRAAQYEKTKAGKTDLQTQKSRSWPDGTKLGAMADKIAKEHGMESAVTPSLKGITLPHFDQTEESDVSFLARIAKRYDAFVKPAGGKLVLAKRGESQNASGQSLPPVALSVNSVTDWRMLKATREGTGSVVAFWHSNRQSKRIQIKVGDGEPTKQLRHYYPTEDAAKKAAQAELDRSKRGQTTFECSLPGDPNLAAECKLTLTGFRPGVPTEWLVRRVEHRLDSAGGYKSTLEAELPNS